MISHEKKFFFAHIPKTGGNSIQSVLEKYSDEKVVYFDNRFGKNQDMALLDTSGQNIKHRSVSWFLRTHPELKDYFKFTCIRNPWDRTISRYFWAYNTFDRNAFMGVINHPEYRAQKFDYDGADFVMRFENIQEDFDKVCDQLEIDRVSLPVMNKSKRGDYHQYYDDETIKMVADKFAPDIEEYGYSFEKRIVNNEN